MREQAINTGNGLRLGKCVLDVDARELRSADGRPIQIRPKTLDVLLLLAEHAGRVVDKAT
jgi:DNA-binding winged-HTH domains